MPTPVTVIAAVMNRPAALRVALASWLVQPGVEEVIVCDWSSAEDLRPLAEIDRRVWVLRVEGEPQFHLSAAYNLAADFASREWLLKLDADYVLNPYRPLLRHHPPEPGEFLTGHGCLDLPNALLHGLDGLLLVERSAFRAIHGYNEHLIGWGYDDIDVRARLAAQGHTERILDFRRHCAMHLWHDCDERVKHYAEKDSRTNARNRERAERGDYTARLIRWQTHWTGRTGLAWRV